MQMHRYYRSSIAACTLVLTLFLFMSLATAAPNAVLLQKSKDSKEAIIKDLEKFVNIDTGTAYEEGLKKYQGILIERLKAMGAKVEVTEVDKPVAGYNIIATFTGTGKGSILLLAHADTVWGVGEAAKRPFRIEGDKAFGPGVSDDKGGSSLGSVCLAVDQGHGLQRFCQNHVSEQPGRREGLTQVAGPDHAVGQGTCLYTGLRTRNSWRQSDELAQRNRHT